MLKIFKHLGYIGWIIFLAVELIGLYTTIACFVDRMAIKGNAFLVYDRGGADELLIACGLVLICVGFGLAYLISSTDEDTGGPAQKA